MPSQRIATIDISRGLALVAIMVFHFVYDLALFGLVPSGTMKSEFWRWFASLTAGSFLFLAGISLWLAHGAAIRWQPFAKRLGIIAMATALVSAISYAAVPERFIYFGVLHSIALSSVVGLLFLRLSPMIGLAVAAVVVCLPLVGGASAAFDSPFLLWTGLSETRPPSLDYLPFVPWFAPFLIGILCARFFFERPAREGGKKAEVHPVATAGILIWMGRHSLLVYLVHQPIFVGLLWALTALLHE